MTLNEFLATAKTYIRYEEELYADILNKSRKEDPVGESSKMLFQEKKKEGIPAQEGKRPVGRFMEYTPLAMSWEKILAEIIIADLKEAGSNHQRLPLRRRRELIKQSIFGSTSVTYT